MKGAKENFNERGCNLTCILRSQYKKKECYEIEEENSAKGIQSLHRKDFYSRVKKREEKEDCKSFVLHEPTKRF